MKQPTALRWVPRREELLAATHEGELISVDPVLGTRVVADGLGETTVLDIHQDRKRFLAVCRDGTWRVGTLTGQTVLNGSHEFVGGMGGFLAERHAVIVGDEHGARVMRILSLTDGSTTGVVRLPAKVVGTMAPSGQPLLARSTAAGLRVIPIGKDHAFPADLESTAHRLSPSGEYILGFTSTGICVWGQEGGVPRSMRLPDLTAGDISKDGQYLGLGTKNGAVALARMDRMEKRVRPDLVRAFTDPVTSVSFSTKGKWLATGAEGLRIWSWED
ncbi:MAG: WD40 repeat domain-containing protein [Myxococcota bacterium]